MSARRIHGIETFMDAGHLYDDLESRYREIREMKGESAYSPAFKEWRQGVESILIALYGPEGDPLVRFRAIPSTPLYLTCRIDDNVFQEAFLEGLEEARILIEELLDRRRRFST